MLMLVLLNVSNNIFSIQHLFFFKCAEKYHFQITERPKFAIKLYRKCVLFDSFYCGIELHFRLMNITDLKKVFTGCAIINMTRL